MSRVLAILTAPRILFSLGFAGFGLAAIIGTLGQNDPKLTLLLTLLTMVLIGSLTLTHWLVSLALFGGATAAYGAVLLLGKTPLGTIPEIIRAGALLAGAALVAWGLSLAVKRLENFQAQQRALINDLSLYDRKTGAIRARHFKSILDYEVERARRYQQPLTIANIEIIEAPHGKVGEEHPSEDEVWLELSKLLQSKLRTVDRLALSGNGGWLILLPDTDHKGAQVLANRLALLSKEQLLTTIALGLATFPADGATGDDLLSEANAALEFARLNALPVASRTLLDL